MAVSFNGSSDVYDMGAPAVLAPANGLQITLCCWVNFANFTGTQTFVAHGFNGTTTSYQFQLGGGAMSWEAFTSPSTFHGIVSWAFTWTTNTWFHCLGTYDGTNWNLYSNGVLVAGPIADAGPFAGGRDFTVGSVDANGTYSQFFNGCMADVAVFSGALNTTEIANLGNGSIRPNTGMSKTLLGYWPLNAGGTTTPDTSGNNSTGNQVTTTPATCGSSPPFTSGIVLLPASLRMT